MRRGIYLYARNKRLTITERSGILEAVIDYYKDCHWSSDTPDDNRTGQEDVPPNKILAN